MRGYEVDQRYTHKNEFKCYESPCGVMRDVSLILVGALSGYESPCGVMSLPALRARDSRLRLRIPMRGYEV